jgi:hypothetical protein
LGVITLMKDKRIGSLVSESSALRDAASPRAYQRRP